MKTSFTRRAVRTIAAIILITSGLTARAKDYTTTLAPGVNVTYAVNTTDKIAAVKKVTDTNSIPVTSVTIPATVKYKTCGKTYKLSVTKIRESAFSGAKFETVNIPSGIVSIGNHAFAGSKLKEFTIPAACMSLGEGVFSQCEDLTSITIVSQLTSIPVRFAYDCYNLKNVTLSSTLTTIGHRFLDVRYREHQFP